MKLQTLAGVPRNSQRWPEVPGVLFSAFVNTGHTFIPQYSHVMLHPILPGSIWPVDYQHSSMMVTPVELSHLYVVPDERRKGIGLKLLSCAMTYAKRRNWKVVLRVLPYGTGSKMEVEQLVKLYSRFGLEPIESSGIVYMRTHDYRR